MTDWECSIFAFNNNCDIGVFALQVCLYNPFLCWIQKMKILPVEIFLLLIYSACLIYKPIFVSDPLSLLSRPFYRLRVLVYWVNDCLECIQYIIFLELVYLCTVYTCFLLSNTKFIRNFFISVINSHQIIIFYQFEMPVWKMLYAGELFRVNLNPSMIFLIKDFLEKIM